MMSLCEKQNSDLHTVAYSSIVFLEPCLVLEGMLWVWFCNKTKQSCKNVIFFSTRIKMWGYYSSIFLSPQWPTIEIPVHQAD